MKPLVADALWERVLPLLRPRQRCFRFTGRKPPDDRKILTGVLFVLKTGIAGDNLPPERAALATRPAATTPGSGARRASAGNRTPCCGTNSTAPTRSTGSGPNRRLHRQGRNCLRTGLKSDRG
jgi:hypothetical protein